MIIKRIKKITLSAGLFLGLAGIVLSQSYIIIPNDTIYQIGTMDHLETLSIQFQSTSADSLTLKWQKVSEFLPDGWEAEICDNSFCFPNLANNGTMNAVSQTELALLVLHITPHINQGLAIIRYEIWDASTPMNRDTLTYILQSTLNSVPIELKAPEISIYPVPADGIINIQSELIEKLEYVIRDFNGNRIQNGNCNSYKMSFSTEGIPSGTYAISFEKNQRILNSKKIIILHQ